MPRLFTFLVSLFLFSYSIDVFAQDKSALSYYGDIRFAYIGDNTEGHGFGGENSILRIRPGLRYSFNDRHSLSGRAVYVVTKNFEPFEWSLQANGNGSLAFGSLSMDELYYGYQDEKQELKFGRFQKTINVKSNANRSNIRFHSNGNFVHWSDGLFYTRSLKAGWVSELILEYQAQNHISYPYQASLDFGAASSNLVSYLGFENRERDQNNIIQKGFGLMYIPNAYRKGTSYHDYVALGARIAIDLPRPTLLRGGSFRIAGEIGQNLNTDFNDGSSLVTSFGINNYAERHELMIEFAKTDAEWLTSTAFAPNVDELEIRYRFFFSSQLNMDLRYRIRDSQQAQEPVRYSTFFRMVYKF